MADREPMQGLAEWLRSYAEHGYLSAESRNGLRTWADEVEAARRLPSPSTETAPVAHVHIEGDEVSLSTTPAQHEALLRMNNAPLYAAPAPVAGEEVMERVPDWRIVWDALDAAARGVINEEARNTVREWLARAWHHNVCPALRSTPPQGAAATADELRQAPPLLSESEVYALGERWHDEESTASLTHDDPTQCEHRALEVNAFCAGYLARDRAASTLVPQGESHD